jgi:hypothetical protein
MLNPFLFWLNVDSIIIQYRIACWLRIIWLTLSFLLTKSFPPALSNLLLVTSQNNWVDGIQSDISPHGPIFMFADTIF